jgi:membrane protein
MGAKRHLFKFLTRWAPKFQLLSKSVGRFKDADGTTMAAALAYYTTFSIAPLLLIVISIVGLVFGRQAVQHQVEAQIQSLIGQGAATQIGGMVKNAAQHSSTGILGAVLGGLALFVGATGAFSQLQSSLNRIWHVKPDPRSGGIKSFIVKRILSFGMILAIAFLLLVSLAVSAALAAFGSLLSELLPAAFSHPVLMAVSFIISLMIIAALFAAMFKVLPDANIDWRDVWIGAGLTAILFTIGKFLIGLYLGHSAIASAYGAAGSFVLIVLWIYYSSLIFLFCAQLTATWTEARTGTIKPKRGAVRVEEENIEPKQSREPRRAA